ncbi:beta-ketoacyl-[acyl-carrier-protein] synthase family protein [Phytohabitans rumicis]|uniref:Beta-ketoacyl synthase n=1 Tax=Phytohabitans rumicis TaxID=1076125 RepID=A0A6V8LBI2_9ACTN|nr:beta-ketoacyl-[acyl-carrier-protein] synthase family protein [Phytohabitans rumicis]GFJ92131.1 beta-ketoacyl synthase [Phytohabitans rumicis]
MDRDGVVVSGVGAVSPAGLGADALWRAIVDRRVVTGPVTRFDVSGYPTGRAGEVPPGAIAALESLVPAHESLAARYLATAVLEALGDAGLPAHRRRGRIGVFVGTVMGTRPILDRVIGDGPLGVPDRAWARPDELLSVVRQVIDVDGPAIVLSPGCSAGNEAIAAGRAAVVSGEVDVAICGGADELSLEVFAFFTSLRALATDVIRPFDVGRRGTMPGEGAAVLVLERADRVAARGRRPLADVLACASAADAYSLTQPHPDGAGLIATIQTCLDRAGIEPDDIDWVCAHGTGTPANDAVEARAVAKALAGRRRPVLSSVKGQLGHAEGAAAVLEAVIGVRALAHDFIPGNLTLLDPDPECAGVDLVEAAGRPAPVRKVLSQAYGFGGGVCTVLLAKSGAHA